MKKKMTLMIWSMSLIMGISRVWAQSKLQSLCSRHTLTLATHLT
uniref:Uncharacterized protein MANES_12G146600 n=1 Tax=Rhizophora mucronata TaxID=61149 RepID=A0A2P2MR58_RHIMU